MNKNNQREESEDSSKGDPACMLCNGTGVFLSPNGEDDYDKEVCACVQEPKSIDELLTHLAGVTGLNL